MKSMKLCWFIGRTNWASVKLRIVIHVILVHMYFIFSVDGQCFSQLRKRGRQLVAASKRPLSLVPTLMLDRVGSSNDTSSLD